MGALLWIGKMFAKLAVLFAKFDSMGLFDALAMLFGAMPEEEATTGTDVTVTE
ncbi:MAG: hypothetical protein IKM24_03185 [Clostridia bacterium]|nr:hypothetical protein [Clostridia bacterium]MBR6780002.1 hypothetical protein [Clostridia bacterium]